MSKRKFVSMVLLALASALCLSCAVFFTACSINIAPQSSQSTEQSGISSDSNESGEDSSGNDGNSGGEQSGSSGGESGEDSGGGDSSGGGQENDEPQVVEVTSVSLDKTSLTLEVSESETLTATVLPGNATEKAVTWTSSVQSVATVANGRVTAVGSGVATITATTNNGKTATCTVTVNAAVPAITQVEGATIDGTDIFMVVDHTTDSVALLNKVTVSSGRWDLYSDILGQKRIPTKIAAGSDGKLQNGDNVFYIMLENENGDLTAVYTLTVYRSYAVSVNYYNHKNVLVHSETAYTGYEYALNFDYSTPGYTFHAWEEEGAAYQTRVLWDALSLYADMTANEYTVTLDANGGTVDTTEQKVTYDEAYAFPLPEHEGHTFLGWYVGSTQITEANGDGIAVWSYAANQTATARWSVNRYNVTLRRNDTRAGSVSGAGEHDYGEEVMITAFTNDGYNFLGWYDENDELVTADAYYTFIMGTDALTYTAKWDYYTVTAQQFSANGSVSDYNNRKVSAGETVTLTATPDLGYVCLGWYDGETLLTGNATYSFVMDRQNITYTAKWQIAAEMIPFTFTSTQTTCTVTGIADNTVTEIVVPDYVTDISHGAFSGCSSLESITLPVVGVSQTFSSGSGYQYTYHYPFGSIFGVSSYTGGIKTQQFVYVTDDSGTVQFFYEDYYIPASLSSVTITGVNIPNYAFDNCSNLISVTIEDSVTSIGYYAFRDCTGLTSITIGNNVTSIGDYAFDDCTGLTKIYYNAVEVADLNSSSNVFYNVGKIGNDIEVIFGNTVKYIPANLFRVDSYSPNITRVIISDGVISIGNCAFLNCNELTSIIIPNSVTSIGNYAFSGCSGLTNISIPNSVTSIGKEAFSGCDNLFQTENGVSYVDKWVIGFDSSLTSVTLRNDTIGIADSAFSSCHGLTGVTISDSVTSIGRYAFDNCTDLTSITIGNNVTSIGERAFYNCSGLTIYCRAASQPTGWNSDWNFTDCPVVWNYGENNVADDGYIYTVIDGVRYALKDGVAIVVIQGKTLNGIISIPEKVTYLETSYSVTSIRGSAFSSCHGLTGVIIPDSVTSIGRYAFNNCTSLTSVTFENPDGWLRKSYGSASFYISNLSDSSIAATYLTETYCSYDWSRS